jgi:hypothetical protein
MKMEIESKEENDGSCKSSLQPSEWEKEKKFISDSAKTQRNFSRPGIRINTSKGKRYVQVKDIFGKWNTVGELNPRNLGTAFGIFMDGIEETENTRWKDHGIKKGAIKSFEDLREFKESSQDDEVKIKKTWEMFDKRLKANRKLRKKQFKALRKVMTPEKEEITKTEEGEGKDNDVQ